MPASASRPTTAPPSTRSGALPLQLHSLNRCDSSSSAVGPEPEAHCACLCGHPDLGGWHRNSFRVCAFAFPGFWLACHQHLARRKVVQRGRQLHVLHAELSHHRPLLAPLGQHTFAISGPGPSTRPIPHSTSDSSALDGAVIHTVLLWYCCSCTPHSACMLCEVREPVHRMLAVFAEASASPPLFLCRSAYAAQHSTAVAVVWHTSQCVAAFCMVSEL